MQSEVRQGGGVSAITSAVTSSSPVTSNTVKPHGTRIVTGSRDKTIRIWSTDTFEELLIIVRECDVVI